MAEDLLRIRRLKWFFCAGATSTALFFTCLELRGAETGNAAEELAPPDIETLVKESQQLRVDTASRHSQTLAEAPSTITVVTTDEIKRYGYRTLADILESAPGLYVSYDRAHSFLGVRGFNRGDYNSRVLILVDGHRVNNPLTGGAFIGEDFIVDVDLIDQVEIVRGPGAALWGNNAFFGVINVKTRKGTTEGIGGEVSGEIASFDTYKARATYGHTFTNGL